MHVGNLESTKNTYWSSSRLEDNRAAMNKKCSRHLIYARSCVNKDFVHRAAMNKKCSRHLIYARSCVNKDFVHSSSIGLT